MSGLEVVESDSLPDGLRARLVNRSIELARGDARTAKRFSIAHELGHHKMGTVHGTAPSYEVEANNFASELLVPKRALIEAAAAKRSVYELAELFAVSREVIEIAAEQHRLTLS